MRHCRFATTACRKAKTSERGQHEPEHIQHGGGCFEARPVEVNLLHHPERVAKINEAGHCDGLRAAGTCCNPDKLYAFLTPGEITPPSVT
ncbi:MAG: hypothetical protein LC676_19965 [Loktanella sp.]|nr:hypothetical protein [Loktanella sp.]